MKLPSFFQRHFLTGIFGAAIFLILLNFSLAYFNLSSSRPLIIHFTAEQGIDFFGTRADVFKIIIISFAIVLINLFLGIVLFEKERILSYLLGVASLIFSSLILAVLAVLMLVN